MTARVIHGDCLEAMRQLIADGIRVDAVVTDPPYHLKSVTGRLGADGAAPIKHGKDGAFARAAAGFMGKKWDGGTISFQPQTWQLALMLLKPGGYLLSFGHPRTAHRMATAIEDAGAEICDTICWLYGSGFAKGRKQTGDWQGWSSELKPAFEPITVAQRQFEGSIRANLSRHGLGALHIAAGMVPAEGRAPRFPANVCHDGSDEVLAAFPVAGGQLVKASTRDPTSRKTQNVYGEMCRGGDGMVPRGDAGTAARFFYCAKASKAERAGSDHPTVKPLKLMRWLLRLVASPGAVILDPFAGTGTTGEAAILEGMTPILIEGEDEYVPTIHKRLERGKRAAQVAA